MSGSYVADRLYKRLFRLWELPKAEHEAGREDWCRVNAIAGLRWQGRVLDYGCGDGTLGAMVASRNPLVRQIDGVDSDAVQIRNARSLWRSWPQLRFSHLTGFMAVQPLHTYDGLLLCEVLEHLDEAAGDELLNTLRDTLKPGAHVCMTVPHANGSRAVFPGHVRTYLHPPQPSWVKDAQARTIDVPDPTDPWHMVPVWWMTTGIVG